MFGFFYPLHYLGLVIFITFGRLTTNLYSLMLTLLIPFQDFSLHIHNKSTVVGFLDGCAVIGSSLLIPKNFLASFPRVLLYCIILV